jgi:hypothetical protein
VFKGSVPVKEGHHRFKKEVNATLNYYDVETGSLTFEKRSSNGRSTDQSNHALFQQYSLLYR